MENKNLKTLDVRTLLGSGKDPLATILEAKGEMKLGDALIILAPFEPVPLYAYFHTAAFTINPRQQTNGDWEVEFRLSGKSGDSHPHGLDLRKETESAAIETICSALTSLGREENLIIETAFHPRAIFEHLDEGHYDFDYEEKGSAQYITQIWRTGN